ncbi:hypothetical protein SGLAM104S_03466 [Streptomyces glaucescens]
MTVAALLAREGAGNCHAHRVPSAGTPEPNDLPLDLGPSQGPELVGRVADSVRRVTSFLHERRSVVADTSDLFLAAEQALLLGHPLHPTPKSREGITEAEARPYSPELRGSFPLHWLAVAPSLLATDSAWTERGRPVPAPRLTARLAGPDLALPEGHAALPLHPWQFREIRHSPEIASLLDAGLLRDLGTHGAPWHPTSSVRTVYRSEAPAMLKLSLGLRITNSRRENLRKELHRGAEVHRLLRSGLSQQWRAAHPCFDIVRDPAWLAVDGPEGSPVTGLDVMIRHNPFAPADDVSCVAGLVTPQAPAGALATQPVHSRLAQLVGRLATLTGLPGAAVAAEWFLRYLERVVRPVLWLDGEAGVALEAHQQNTLLLLDGHGWPAGGRWGPHRDALADALAAEADYARRLRHDPVARFDPAPLMEARNAATVTPRQARRRPAELHGARGLAERIRPVLASLADPALGVPAQGPARDRVRELLAAAATVLDACAHAVRHGTPVSPPAPALAALRTPDTGSILTGPPSRAATRLARLLADVVEAAEGPREPRQPAGHHLPVPHLPRPTLFQLIPVALKAMRDELRSAASPITRHAVRVTAVATTGYLLGSALPLGHGYWAPLAAVMSMRPDFSQTYSRVVARLAGTVLGVAVATAVVRFADPGTRLSAALAVLSAGLLYLLMRTGQFAAQACIAAYVVLLLGMAGEQSDPDRPRTGAAHPPRRPAGDALLRRLPGLGDSAAARPPRRLAGRPGGLRRRRAAPPRGPRVGLRRRHPGRPARRPGRPRGLARGRRPRGARTRAPPRPGQGRGGRRRGGADPDGPGDDAAGGPRPGPRRPARAPGRPPRRRPAQGHGPRRESGARTPGPAVGNRRGRPRRPGLAGRRHRRTPRRPAPAHVPGPAVRRSARGLGPRKRAREARVRARAGLRGRPAPP